MYIQLGFYFFLLLLIGVSGYSIYLMRSGEQNRPARSKKYLALAFIAYISAVVALTIIPSDRFSLNNSIPLTNYIPLLNTYKRYALVTYFENQHGIKNFWQNLIGNILLFIPMGIFLSLLFKKRLWPVVLIALTASCCIELIQYLSRFFGYYRHIDIDDVLLNTFGSVVGYWGVRLYRVLKFRKQPE